MISTPSVDPLFDPQEWSEEQVELTREMLKKNLHFKYKKPITARLELSLDFIKELEIKSNARYVEVYVNQEYQCTTTGKVKDLCLLLSGDLKLKFFLRNSDILEIKEILVNGQNVNQFMDRKENILDKKTDLDIIRDQLHVLELKMDYKLSRIQSLLEQVILK